MIPVRLALVGAGRIASTYAQVLAACGDLEVVGVVDIEAEAAEKLAFDLGAAALSSHRELAELDGLEAVLICTPPSTHSELSMFFLESGVHVMCEKPLAVTVEEARRMLEVAEYQNLTLTMATKFRYVSDVLKARSIVNSGILGDIILIENTFASRVDMSDRWNADARIAGGGVLIDNGTHSVDLTRFFLGPIAEVMAVEGKRVQGLEVEDTAQVFLRSHDMIRATIDLSWSINKERQSYLEIYGSHGTVQVGWSVSRYRQLSSPDWVEFGNGYHKMQAIRDQMSNFARALRGVEMLQITAIDALASVEVVEAAYNSLGKDNWVKIGSGPASSAV